MGPSKIGFWPAVDFGKSAPPVASTYGREACPQQKKTTCVLGYLRRYLHLNLHLLQREAGSRREGALGCLPQSKSRYVFPNVSEPPFFTHHYCTLTFRAWCTPWQQHDAPAEIHQLESGVALVACRPRQSIRCVGLEVQCHVNALLRGWWPKRTQAVM